MNLTTLRAADFKKIVGLMKEKETLLAQITKLNRELEAFGSVTPAEAARRSPVTYRPGFGFWGG